MGRIWGRIIIRPYDFAYPQAMRSIAGGVGERVPPQKNTQSGRCGPAFEARLWG